MKRNIQNSSRRLLAMLLCLAMLAAVIPALNAKAAAASDSEWGTGSVTAAMEVADQTYALTCTSHSFTSVTYGTTCQTYAHTCYTCTKCGYSYNTFPADASMSDWQTEFPNMDASMVETGTQYRYRNYETVTSYETDLEDHELVGSQWVKYDTTAVNYVTQWPSGFDTDNSLYNKYANQRQKVSNYTADLTKLEVNSDAVVGYLYYHWCYSGHPYTSATNTGSYNRFHAYYSTETPSSANASDPADSSYRFDSSTACSDSKWYFAVPVYAQTYTTYKNQFTYRCWGEPSQWSTTPVTETDSRQVETRTVYRYVTAELPEHNYVNNVCTVCGQSRLSANYYLFGYINGADYACEADYLNMGAYKFVDGKLAARFEQDSYVGVKSEGNADWYMTAGWQGSATTVILYNTNELTNSDKLLVPGGVDLVFTLADNGNGTLTLSYTQATGECKHNYTGVITKPTCTKSGYTTYTCTLCGYSYIGDRTNAVDHSYSTTIVPNTCTEAGYTLYSCGACGYSYASDYTDASHSYEDGYCTGCGEKDPSYVATYYLVGYINGADYGCEGDYENLGQYQFVNGKLSVTFTQDSYVFLKTGDNAKWLLAASYCTDTVCTFKEGNSEKMFVPGNVQLTFTLAENGDGSVTLSYVKANTGCKHTYNSGVITTNPTCTTAGVKTFTCSLCADSYTEIISAKGHSYASGVCSTCGAADPNYGGTTANTYYLVGWINGADYGCESDWENMGQYKFVNGRLTATFDQDSYVFLKTEGNGKWLLSDAYCTDSTCTFREGSSEKMFIPGNVQLNFTLTENADGSVTMSYTTSSTEPSAVPTLTLKAPTLEFKDMITVNAFYTAENIEDVVEMGMITYSTKVYDWSVATAEHVIPGATYDASTGRYFSSSQGIHAKYLGDSVYLAIYAKLEDGTYAYSKLASYSAVQYATNQLKNSTDTKLKQLVAAMLNYGAEAQLYFGHNIDTLANISMTAAQKALPATYSSSMVSAVPSVPAEKQGSFANNQGFASKKPAISFEGAFCINYFFTPNYTPESGITLYYWNAEDYSAASVLTTSNATGFIKLAGSGTGEYRGDIAGISAKAISEAVYVAAVYKSSGTVWTSGVLGYSIGAYCSSQASKGGDIVGLAMATAVYGYHAKQYFG